MTVKKRGTRKAGFLLGIFPDFQKPVYACGSPTMLDEFDCHFVSFIESMHYG
jgi:hypothetical protein